jgi:hypothetical protein
LLLFVTLNSRRCSRFTTPGLPRHYRKARTRRMRPSAARPQGPAGAKVEFCRRVNLSLGECPATAPRPLQCCFGQRARRVTAGFVGSLLSPSGEQATGPANYPELPRSKVVRAGGLEPPQALLPYGFSYQLRLSPPRLPIRRGAFVVWTIPSPCSGYPEDRCCPSSLYTFP